jgi:succinate dehydrogenase flavin-adding protein (antitoxin of CptAB toxin-antitoxin module)
LFWQVELKQFDEIIEMENPDLYKWLTGQTQVGMKMPPRPAHATPCPTDAIIT